MNVQCIYSRLFHTAPNVPHYASKFIEFNIDEIHFLENKAVGVMKAGNTFTIEPMINMGSMNDELWPDDWTAVTVGFFEKSIFFLTNTHFRPMVSLLLNSSKPYLLRRQVVRF